MTTASVFRHAHTKIVATVGPACREESQLAELIDAGVDVFRINFAHGTLDEHDQVLRRIDRLRQSVRPVAVLADLAGPKIRLGELPGDQVDLEADAACRIIRGEKAGDGELTTNYDRLLDELCVGDRIMLADGMVELTVTDVADHCAQCRVTQPGIIRSRQGVNLPGVRISLPALTPEDEQHARWAATRPVDFFGLSFVRQASEIRRLKQLLAELGSSAGVIAKIEKQEALAELDEIVEESDGVMVARGDLGVEIDPARLPIEQKRIIATAARFGRPVITATQMLESMTHNRRPTRAEASDVANAVLDGTDACMLSGETAIGRYPRITVETMNRIILATEEGSWQNLPADLHCRLPRPLSGAGDGRPAIHPITAAVVHGADQIARALPAKLVAVLSHSGATALAVSKHRSDIPTLGVSDDEATLRKMCLYWGVIPLPGAAADRDELIRRVDDWGRQHGYLTSGDRVVLVIGNHLVPGSHNVVEVHVVP